MATPGHFLVYIGSYTPDTDGRGAGITVCVQDPETGELTPRGEPVATPSPSYLAIHPDGHTLYAVNELEPHGSLGSFAIAMDGSLTPLGTVPTGGSAPCHLTVDPTGEYVITANYGDGRVSVHPIGAHGMAEECTSVVPLAGQGPVPDRQGGPHAHQVTFDSGTLLVCDLGSDHVWRYRFLDGAAHPDTPLTAPPGFGPRHLVHTPHGSWLVGELEPAVLPLLDGEPVPIATADTGTRNHPSVIIAAPDYRHLYIGNRGPDTITTFEIRDETLHQVDETPCGGAWPRDAAIVGDFLYVAAQQSDSVTALRRDPATGLLSHPITALKTGSPTCVATSPRITARE
jgi:6-phosphogluconolactonase (cycloisomerase 2 family)